MERLLKFSDSNKLSLSLKKLYPPPKVGYESYDGRDNNWATDWRINNWGTKWDVIDVN